VEERLDVIFRRLDALDCRGDDQGRSATNAIFSASGGR
jgi:hypothetical protein